MPIQSQTTSQATVPPQKSLFLKYSCDCVGFEITEEDGKRHAYCVCPCDTHHDDPGVTLYERPGLLEKTSEPVSFDRSVKLLHAMSSLMAAGYNFEQLQRILKCPSPSYGG